MIVVVGGHTRNIGKTTVMCRIIAETPDIAWTAIKITQFGHNACSDDGDDCDCAPQSAVHPYALDAETAPNSTDSGRYLEAGAKQSWWLRTRQGELAEAMPELRRLIASNDNVIIESNSVLDLIIPDVFVFVYEKSQDDFKLSAQRHYRRADLTVQIDTPNLGELVLQQGTGKRKQKATC